MEAKMLHVRIQVIDYQKNSFLENISSEKYKKYEWLGPNVRCFPKKEAVVQKGKMPCPLKFVWELQKNKAHQIEGMSKM